MIRSRIRSRLDTVCTIAQRGEAGQVMVLFAVFLIVLMVLAGSAYDYASIVVDEARLQNAVDAAALAGSDTLSSNATTGNRVNAAQTATTQYLNVNHVDNSNASISITPLPYVPPAGTPTPSPAVYDGVSVNVTRSHQTAFWPLVGIPQVTLHGAAQARGARTMLDVMLSLDMTYSEYVTSSLTDISNASAAFIKQLNPTQGDPGGARIALGRFAGRQACTGGHWVGLSYQYTSCSGDDYTLFTGLTDDKQTLLTLADNSGTAACPAGMSTWACPIHYDTATVNTYGTKLPNSISVVGGPTSGVFQGPNARNNPSTTGIAHKVLILMTDGVDEDLTGANQEGSWDTNFRDVLAPALKAGASSTTALDDVEIYTVNFTCPVNPYTHTQTVYEDKVYCESKVASDGGSGTYACPGPTIPASISPVDDLLIKVSSSTPGTCDHYYPLKKGERLPDLFVRLAGTIARGQLTQ